MAILYGAAHQLTTVSRELQTEKGKVTQLKRDMEGVKKKAKAEHEKATRLVSTLCLTFYSSLGMKLSV